LLTVLLLAESARASRRALAVIAGVCAAGDRRGVWQAVDTGVAARFAEGAPCLVPVAGAAGRVEGAAATPAETEALQAIADVASVALGRCEL
jgi:hypothetical protein